MNYPDEDYVRLYTRDTVTWKLLGWQGRVVLVMMLRSGFDRCGVFRASQSVTGCHDLSRDVRAVTELPREVVDEGLRQVLAEGIWVETESGLTWPGYVEAQTCAKTDRARKVLERRRRADQELSAEPVTIRDGMSHSVTPCHIVSLRADPIRAEDPPIAPLGGPDDSGDPWGLTPTEPGPEPPKQPKPQAKPRGGRVATTKHLLPSEWRPSEAHREQARASGLDCDDQAQRMRDWAASAGARKADWDATFRNWLRTSADRAPQRPSGARVERSSCDGIPQELVG